MKIFKFALASALVIATAVSGMLAAAPALAGEARASGDVAVREGPGSRYAIIDRLIDGQYYEVEECTLRQNWCLVSEDDYELGWVRGSYIVGSGAKNAVTPWDFIYRPFPFHRKVK